MEVNHFLPKSPNLELFKDIENLLNSRVDGSIYKKYENSKHFLRRHEERLELPDITLITAHGQKNAIIELSHEGEKPLKLISIDDSSKFNRNFIFSFSCETAHGLGPAMIESGALTYIGFYSKFSPNFKFNGIPGEKFNDSIALLGKKIFAYAFSIVFSDFINNPCTANEFYNNLMIYIHILLSKVEGFDLEKLIRTFGVPIRKPYFEQHKALIFVTLHSIFDKAYSDINILGEENYIPWFNLSRLNKSKLEEILSSYKMKDERNQYYSTFVKCKVASLLNDDVVKDKNYKLLEKSLQECI
ncbi:hypothetical protein [Acetoanaerobium noterae]|uniref:hypothetical protein n=1 Tax=Acetoanaerobium noterae TaxID=745369 RepID=UPI0033422ADF